MDINEDDIPAKETFQSESSWIQSKNGHSRWKKSSCSKKSKRKKSIISIGHIYVAFSSMQIYVNRENKVWNFPNHWRKTGISSLYTERETLWQQVPCNVSPGEWSRTQPRRNFRQQKSWEQHHKTSFNKADPWELQVTRRTVPMWIWYRDHRKDDRQRPVIP